MVDFPFVTSYAVGTATVAANGTTVTGQGTFWQDSDNPELSPIRAGDLFGTHKGRAIRIQEVVGPGELELAHPWPDTAQTAAEYEIQLTPRIVGSQQATRILQKQLSSGNLTAFAELEGASQLLPIFTGAGTMDLVTKQSLVSGANYDVQVADMAARAAYDIQEKDFAVLVSDDGTGRAVLFTKLSSSSGDWSPPAYITGPIGRDGVNPRAEWNATDTYEQDDLAYWGGSTWIAKTAVPANNAPPSLPSTENTYWRIFARSGSTGVNSRGTYSASTDYAANDLVLYNGSSWIALQPTTGNAPPNLPTTANAYWRLVASKGTDGTGTGDVVGPSSAVNNRVAVFDGVTGKLIKDSGITLGNAASRNVGSAAGTVAAGDDPRFAAGGSSQNEAILALAIADLQGKALGMKGGVADAFDDNTGIIPPQGGLDANTLVLLHFDGSNGSTSIVDSASARVWTAVGDAKLSNSYSVFGGTSLALDGAGDYVQTTDLSGLSFGTGDFCIDARIRLNSVGASLFICDMRSADTQIAMCFYVASSKLSIYINGANRITGTTTLVANTDYHVAVERTAGVTKIFLNGSQEGASYADANNYVANALKIGSAWSVSSFLNGFVDEFRVSNVGRWSENFAVPTGAYYADLNNSFNYVYDATNDWFSPVVATASSRITGATPSGLVNTPANVNDNNPSTSASWAGTDLTSASINARKLAQLDLGSVQNISKIEAVGYSQSVGGNSLAGLYYSIDGTNWTQLGANITVGQTPVTYAATGSVSARYVALILGATNYTSATSTLQDLNAYGTPSTPAYSNPGGSGDRSASIAVTTSGFTYGGGSVQNLVNGNTADNSLYFSGGSGQTGYIQFDFGAGNAKYIDQFSFYQVASYAGTGPWSWSGSNDGVNFTTLLASFSLASGNPAIIDIPAHAIAYRYFRLSGNNALFGGGYLNEINFRIATAPPSTQNMTLASINYPIVISPSTGRVTVQTVEFESGVPNVDFSVELSRDGGATYKAANLAIIPNLTTGNIKMYDDTAFSFASLPTGSNLKWRFKTLTNKNIGLSGIVAQGGS